MLPAPVWAAAVGFSYPTLTLQSVAGYGVAAGVAAAAVAWSLKKIALGIWRPQLPKPVFRNVIPFERIAEDGMTVRMGDGSRLVAVEIGGINYAAANEDQLTAAWRARVRWLQALSQLRVEATVINERARMDVRIGGGLGNEWLQAVNDSWAEGFSDALRNRSWVVLVSRGAKRRRFGRDEEGGGSVSEAARQTLEILEGHSPRVLRHTMADDEESSELWRFLAWLVNRNEGTGVQPPGDDISRGLVWSSVWFDPATGMIEQSSGDETVYCQAVAVSDFAPETDLRTLGQLMRLPFEVSVFEHIETQTKFESLKYVQTRSRNALALLADRRIKEDLDSFREDTVAERETGGLAAFEVTAFVYGETPALVRERVLEVRKVLEREQYRAVTEIAYCEEAWRARFFGKVQRLRPWTVRFVNIADLTPCEATPTGLAACWWGERPLRTVRTAQGTPYEFGIHEHGREEALSNTLIFGRPGSGKTVLAAFLMSGALAHFGGMKVFAFDNLNGLSVPTRAFGGVVVEPGRGRSEKSAGMAPLQMPDTPENRTFLINWLLELAGVGEGDRDAREAAEVALELIMELPAEQRTLATLYAEAVKKNNTFAEGIAAWIGGGAFEGWFDAETDAIDLGEAQWITFDMSYMLEAPRVAAAFVAYLLHRIRTEVWERPTPHIVFMDEAPTLFAASPLFGELAAYLARNIRKKMGSVWFAFQDADGMTDSARVLLASSANFVFFRDPSADTGQLSELFKLSPADIAFIRDLDEQTRHARRAVLLVRKKEAGLESVPLDVNLKALGRYIALYRSGVDAAELMEQMTREHGERWVAPYLEASELLSRRP